MLKQQLSCLLVSFLALTFKQRSAELVFSECDRSKTGSDKFYDFKYNDLKGEEVKILTLLEVGYFGSTQKWGGGQYDPPSLI